MSSFQARLTFLVVQGWTARKRVYIWSSMECHGKIVSPCLVLLKWSKLTYQLHVRSCSEIFTLSSKYHSFSCVAACSP